MNYLPPPSTLPTDCIVDSYRRDSGGSRQEQSTDQQLQALKAFCLEHNLRLRHNFVDEARSGGSTAGRDDFNRMVDLYRHEDDRPDGLLLWNYARFARDFDNAMYYKSLIRTYGIVIHSLNDQIPEGDYGRVIEFFIDMSNEEKRRQTSADSKRGLHDLVQKHGCMPGIPPRGFKREQMIIGARRDGSPHIAHRWVQDPDLIGRVRTAFQMRAAGGTLGQIQKETRLFGSINSYATFWPNKLYLGILEFGDLTIQDYCAPIVTREIWDAVQERQNYHKRWKALREPGSTEHPRRKNSRFLLSGLARHGRCGSPLFGNSTKKKNGRVLDSYLCTKAYRQRNCIRERIPRQIFEDKVMEILQGEILDRQQLANIHFLMTADQADSLAEEERRRKDLARQLTKVRRQKNHLADAIAEKGHSKTLLERLTALELEETELAALQTKLESLAAEPVPEVEIGDLLESADEMKLFLANADLDFKRTVLRGYIHHVDIQREGDHLSGTIYFYYPPPIPKASGPDGIDTLRTLSGPPRYQMITRYNNRVIFSLLGRHHRLREDG